LAKKGCRYVAVTSGVIDEIRKKDTYTYKNPTPITKGGIFISMIGDDGVRYYASHLNKIVEGIEIGTRVEVGTLLGIYILELVGRPKSEISGGYEGV
jgi:peptidoglycan LD-endopeptidase LytH